MSNVRDSDAEFVKWLGDRLINVYRESDQADFVRTTYRTSMAIEERDETIRRLRNEVLLYKTAFATLDDPKAFDSDDAKAYIGGALVVAKARKALQGQGNE